MPRLMCQWLRWLLVCLRATASRQLLQFLMSVFTHMVRMLWWPSQEFILCSGLSKFFKVCIVTIIVKSKWHRKAYVHQCHHPLNQFSCIRSVGKTLVHHLMQGWECTDHSTFEHCSSSPPEEEHVQCVYPLLRQVTNQCTKVHQC